MIYSRSRLILDEDRLRQHLKQRGQAFDVTAKMTEDPKTTALAITFEVEAR